jgi:hypothetical protein
MYGKHTFIQYSSYSILGTYVFWVIFDALRLNKLHSEVDRHVAHIKGFAVVYSNLNLDIFDQFEWGRSFYDLGAPHYSGAPRYKTYSAYNIRIYRYSIWLRVARLGLGSHINNYEQLSS